MNQMNTSCFLQNAHRKNCHSNDDGNDVVRKKSCKKSARDFLLSLKYHVYAFFVRGLSLFFPAVIVSRSMILFSVSRATIQEYSTCTLVFCAFTSHSGKSVFLLQDRILATAREGCDEQYYHRNNLEKRGIGKERSEGSNSRSADDLPQIVEYPHQA